MKDHRLANFPSLYSHKGTPIRFVLGLSSGQKLKGGKTRLGSVSKMGQTDIRRLFIVGAMGEIRWVVRKGGNANCWLATLVMRKPKKVAAVALANKMARMIWALTTEEQDYRTA